MQHNAEIGLFTKPSYIYLLDTNRIVVKDYRFLFRACRLPETKIHGIYNYLAVPWSVPWSVVSTSSCPVFLTNEMSGWLKLYKVIAKAEIGWFRGISP